MRRSQTFRVIGGREEPVADIRIGPNNHMRIYGEPKETLGIPLVEIRAGAIFGESLHLKIEQAEAIAAGLTKAVAKARGTP